MDRAGISFLFPFHEYKGVLDLEQKGWKSTQRVNLWAKSKLGLKQKIKKACKSAPA